MVMTLFMPSPPDSDPLALAQREKTKGRGCLHHASRRGYVPLGGVLAAMAVVPLVLRGYGLPPSVNAGGGGCRGSCVLRMLWPRKF